MVSVHADGETVAFIVITAAAVVLIVALPGLQRRYQSIRWQRAISAVLRAYTVGQLPVTHSLRASTKTRILVIARTPPAADLTSSPRAKSAAPAPKHRRA